MPDFETEGRACEILDVLDGLAVADVVLVLSRAIELAVSRASEQNDPAMAAGREAAGRWLLFPKGAFKLERDPEILEYVNRLDRRISVLDLAAELRELFGDRAPSKSALHRYFSRGKKGSEVANETHNGTSETAHSCVEKCTGP